MQVVDRVLYQSGASAGRVNRLLRAALMTRMDTLSKLVFAALLLIADPATDAFAQSGRQLDPSTLPAGTVIQHDRHYGSGTLETYDVYAPKDAHDAPVIFMVHGGGWRRGDKQARGVVQNKVAHWGPKGIIVVSVNYPMLPEAAPLQQAQYVGKALAAAQKAASQWGGDAQRFVLMGHSAGSHLVSLISAQPSIALDQGALPWLGTVALDSAAFDVTTIMRGPHFPLYDAAFGTDQAVWAQASPTLQLNGKIAPLLAVCSSQRRESCAQARGFAEKARTFGTRVEVLPEDLSHGEINAQLGIESAYTAQVDAFLARLDTRLALRLR